jgi:rhamnosyl/mannosyltransferase
MEKEWKSLAAGLNIREKVVFLGDIDDEQLPHFYHAADIFVLPACERSEAYGLVQVEAMASGLPVISTELGTGTSFVNSHGQTGLVVPPKDPRSLRDGILYLLNNPALRQEMGGRAKQRAFKEFSLDVMVERILGLYETANSA